MVAPSGTGRRGPVVAGAILAGGRASRFGGRAKGLEVIGGERIVDRVEAALRAVTAEVVLVGAPESVAASMAGCRPIPDEAPGAGPLGAIVTSLRATGQDTLVVAWDMPFVVAATLERLVADTSEADVVLWARAGDVEPLCALYRASSLATLARVFDGGERSPRNALRHLRARVFDETSGTTSALMSVNNPEELDEARRADAAAVS